MENRTLTVTTVLAVIALPIISAVTLPRNRWQYVRCLLAYAVVFVLVQFGYFFQGVVESATTPNRLNSNEGWLDALKNYGMEYGYGSTGVVLAASMIAWAVLLARQQAQRPVYGFRAAFVVLIGFDIISGTILGYDAGEYLKNLVFDFIGAAAFGCVAPLLLRKLVPTGTKVVSGT